MEAHLYCTLRIATEEDIKQQIDSGQQYFDLVDFDKACAAPFGSCCFAVCLWSCSIFCTLWRAHVESQC